MKAILIEHARIWTNGAGLIEDGFVLIEGDKIARVGKMGDRPKPPKGAEAIDVKGRLLLPGFVCAHTHLYSALARGLALPGVSPKRFGEILEQFWWRLDKALDQERIYYSALIGGIEFIKSGVTTILDHHASPNSIRGSLKAIKRAVVDELGLRASLCYETSDRDGPERAREGIAENIEFFDYAQAEGDDRLSALIGLHASFTLSDETLKRLKRELGDREAGFHIHLAEGPEDQEDSLKRYKKRVVERLRDLGILNDKTVLAHGVHLDENEKAILAEAGAILVHNPQSNMNNAVGVADIPGMLNKGILVGLGNDGFGYEMLSDLRAMTLVHKLARRDPKAMGFDLAHKVFFENNYAIVKRLFGVEVGKIRPGYQADLIIVDYLPPTPLTEGNLMGHLLFGLVGNPRVLTAIVDGRVVMKDRRILGVDEEAAYREARGAAERLWKRIK
ncbi:MAG: putative aminohydrolase SsnA [Candidatus Acetothermia bacterium]|jgi:putative selenium metabolism protein SsnA|nr:putative aminohydrolase SsnA [Candidatus Acetothermia bacterium]MDH7505316.1 putative aminohydrolase SsnA [Candidatus Acetothermia bacterium]